MYVYRTQDHNMLFMERNCTMIFESNLLLHICLLSPTFCALNYHKSYLGHKSYRTNLNKTLPLNFHLLINMSSELLCTPDTFPLSRNFKKSCLTKFNKYDKIQYITKYVQLHTYLKLSTYRKDARPKFSCK